MNNNEQLIQCLSAKMQMPLQTTENILNILVDLMIKELAAGHDLQLPGLGLLETKDLSGRKTVFFKPSAEFTAAI